MKMNNSQDSNSMKALNNSKKIALVTGANSGIGFETAARLTEEGFRKIILAVRTVEKGEIAKTELMERTGKDIFEILTIDVSEFDVINAGADELAKRGDKIDFLVLNAGMSPGNTETRNSTGIEMTFASNIIGHHVFTMRLLEDGLLVKDARILIAGTEGARGDVPGMSPPDFENLANEHFDGNLITAFEAIIRHEKPYEDSVMNLYVTSKTFSAWWAAVLSRKLPSGMTVNAVSPGSVPSTNFARHQGFMLRKIMMPMMNIMGRFMGMAGGVNKAADRYYEASQFDSETTGHFFASRPGKMVGKMEIQENPHFLNREFQEAGWNAIVKVTNGIDYPTALSA